MSEDFHTDKQITIQHGDGFRYVIKQIEDGIIEFSYEEVQDGKFKLLGTPHHFYGDSIRKIAYALLELADDTETDDRHAQTQRKLGRAMGIVQGLSCCDSWEQDAIKRAFEELKEMPG